MTTPGSYRDVENKLRGAINEKYNSGPAGNKVSTWPVDIIPDPPITAGETIIENYDMNKYFKMSFEFDEEGKIILGDAVEVTQTLTYDPVEKGLFVTKDDVKQEVTGPVMLPGCADCDFKRGEKIFSEDEVAKFCEEYDKYRIADEMHLFGETGNQIGTSIKNWTLKSEETYTNVKGESVTLPKGTWMSTVKITDDDVWQKIEDGTYKGFSGTYLPREHATQLMEKITASKSMNPLLDYLESVKRTLIKDIDDPVPPIVAIVDNPCVPNAIFTSVKTCPTTSQKAGRSISDSTLITLQKAHDKAQSALDNVKKLLKKAEGERPEATKEVDDMDEKELAQLVGDTVDKKFDEKVKPISEKIEAIEEKLPEADKKTDPPGKTTPGSEAIKCTKCDHEIKGAAKFCPECGDQILQEGEKPAEKIEDNPVIKSILETQNKISEKLGIPPVSQKIEGQDEDDDEGAGSTKSDEDFYAQAGLKRNGRPKDE